MDSIAQEKLDAVYFALDELKVELNARYVDSLLESIMIKYGIVWDKGEKPRIFQEIQALGFTDALALYTEVLTAFGQTETLAETMAAIDGQPEQVFWDILEVAVNS